jgi:hypothetical protein
MVNHAGCFIGSNPRIHQRRKEIIMTRPTETPTKTQPLKCFACAFGVGLILSLTFFYDSSAEDIDSKVQPLSNAPTTNDTSNAADADSANPAAGAEALAKAAQNPIAKMISVPFQNNFYFGLGPNHVTEWDLNVEPVIPFSLNDNWNLITRTIIPIINLPSPARGVPSAFGLGDINPQFYFSPAKPGKLIWGVGPTFTFPTATSAVLGSGEYSAGPAVVLLTVQGHWLYGVLANNQWSYAGWRNQNVNALLVQPFINYNMPHGWYITTSPIITANWEASSDNVWTVPVGGGIGKIFKIGKQPFNAQIQAFDNVQKPDNGSDWQLRFQIQLLFP